MNKFDYIETLEHFLTKMLGDNYENIIRFGYDMEVDEFVKKCLYREKVYANGSYSLVWQSRI